MLITNLTEKPVRFIPIAIDFKVLKKELNTKTRRHKVLHFNSLLSGKNSLFRAEALLGSRFD